MSLHTFTSCAGEERLPRSPPKLQQSHPPHHRQRTEMCAIVSSIQGHKDHFRSRKWACGQHTPNLVFFHYIFSFKKFLLTLILTHWMMTGHFSKNIYLCYLNQSLWTMLEKQNGYVHTFFHTEAWILQGMVTNVTYIFSIGPFPLGHTLWTKQIVSLFFVCDKSKCLDWFPSPNKCLSLDLKN